MRFLKSDKSDFFFFAFFLVLKIALFFKIISKTNEVLKIGQERLFFLFFYFALVASTKNKKALHLCLYKCSAFLFLNLLPQPLKPQSSMTCLPFLSKT